MGFLKATTNLNPSDCELRQKLGEEKFNKFKLNEQKFAEQRTRQNNNNNNCPQLCDFSNNNLTTTTTTRRTNNQQTFGIVGNGGRTLNYDKVNGGTLISDFDKSELIGQNYKWVKDGIPLYSPTLGAVRVQLEKPYGNKGMEYVVNIIDPFDHEDKNKGPYYKGILGKDFQPVKAVIYNLPNKIKSKITIDSPVVLLLRKQGDKKSMTYGERVEKPLGKVFSGIKNKLNPEYDSAINILTASGEDMFDNLQAYKDIVEIPIRKK